MTFEQIKIELGKMIGLFVIIVIAFTLGREFLKWIINITSSKKQK